MASGKLVVFVALVGLVALTYAAPADKQLDVEAVPLEGPEGAVGPQLNAPVKDLKASSSYGLGYAYPYGGYGGLGYGYPYGYGYGLGYGYSYYPRYYYGGYHGYPYF